STTGSWTRESSPRSSPHEHRQDRRVRPVLEDQQPLELDARRISDVRPAHVPEIGACHPAHVGARHGLEISHELRARVEVPAIELVSREKIRLRRDRLVVEEILRDELLYERTQP